MKPVPDMEEADETISLCSLNVDNRRYGIDILSILEVLEGRMIQSVPLAPPFIGGVMPYRGEVLTAIDFRALLGLPSRGGESCVIVLGEVCPDADRENCGEIYGLMVDGVGGVVTVSGRSFAVNPPTLDEASKALFNGAYRMPNGLLLRLDPQRLAPVRLAASGLFGISVPVTAGPNVYGTGGDRCGF